MNHVPSSTKLKIFLSNLSSSFGEQKNNYFSFVALAALVLLASCAPTRPVGRTTTSSSSQILLPANQSPDDRVTQPGLEDVVPPWQLWSSDAQGSPDLEAGEAFLRFGDNQKAIEAFERAAKTGTTANIRFEGFVRKLGALLRAEQPKPVLELVTKYLQERGQTIEQVSPGLSLLVAFAYVEQSNRDQALAWIALTNKNQTGGVLSRRALSLAERVIGNTAPKDFESAASRWQKDQVLAEIFERERARRQQGIAPGPEPLAEWRDAVKKQTALRNNAPFPESALPPVNETPISGEVTFGVLLPLSGKFGEHGMRVKQGIELAVKEYQQSTGKTVRVVSGDTKGEAVDAGNEYDRLVRDERAAVVFGPLLVKTAEEVARRSQIAGVPFLTFTKRPGITTLSKVGFRLGATSDDQVHELLSYAVEQLHAKRLVTISPQDPVGQDFAAQLKDQARKFPVEIVGNVTYVPGDVDAMKSAVREVGATAADAVFVPDELEGIYQLFDELHRSSMANATVMGPALWDDPVAVRGFGQLLEGGVYATPFYAQSERPIVTKFVADYRSNYGKDPDILAAQGYDAAHLVLRALETGNGTVSELLKRSSPLDGVTGQLTVEGSGEVRRRMSVLRIHLGDPVEVMAAGVETGFVPEKPVQ